jgi:hypothetical protein
MKERKKKFLKERANLVNLKMKNSKERVIF